MKATLEFTLPDETAEHLDAINGSAYKFVLQDLDEHLRQQIKYGANENGECKKVLDDVRQILHSYLEQRNLQIHE